MERLNGVLRFCLLGAFASGLLSGCAPVQTAPPPPAHPASYVVKPSPTNFIYEPQQSPNKSASKVVIAIVRPRLEKEEGGHLVTSVQSTHDLAKKEADWRTRHQQLEQASRALAIQYNQLPAGSIFQGIALQNDQEKVQGQLRQANEVLKLIELIKSGEKEVSGRVKTMQDAFLDSAQRDLERLLIAKGLKTSGPFKDHEDMTFSEKKDATFELPPTIKLAIAPGAQPTFDPGETTWTGEVAVSGEFSLILIEPMSGQKIWAKRLPIPKRTAPWKIENSGTTTTDDRAEVTANVLSALYKELMDTIGKHTDPDEFAALSTQSAELKERAAPRMK